MAALRILGLDPGTRIAGWGVLTLEGRDARLNWGTIRTTHDSRAGKLTDLTRAICSVAQQYPPDAVAIEDSFLAKNVRTTVALGQAQAALILGVAAGLQVDDPPIYFYPPATVKRVVAGKGNAPKPEVTAALRRYLALDDAFQPSEDASDALGVALCHWLSTGHGVH